VTVGELVIRIRADVDALERGLAEGRAEIEAFDESVRGSSDSIDKANGSWISWAGALKFGIPIVSGAALAALQMTGNLGALGAALPVVTVALGAFLAPFASLAAIVVLLIGPMAVLIGLAGGLAAAFGFTFMKEAADKTSYLYGKVQQLASMFQHLLGVLAQDFKPEFMFLIDSAQKAILYFDRLAHMPLAEAFKSLSTTGVAAVAKFLEQVGHLIAKPLRLAVQFAFGTGGNSANSALGGLWAQVRRFLAAPAGGKPSIDATIENWFGARDFTAIGMRWGTELAGALMTYFGQALQHLLSSRGGKMILGGAGVGTAIGAALGGPIGAALGLAIGSAAGIVLNHYWPRLRAGGIQAFESVKAKAISVFHEITTALEHFLGPTTWANLGAIARSVWTMIRTVAVGSFRAAIAVGRTVWAVFDTLVIKTGLWKVALALVKAVIFVVAAVLRPVIAIIARLVSEAVRLGGVFNGAVLAGVRAVYGAISAIIGGISAAIGDAERLASALNSVNPFHGGNTNPSGNPGAGSGRGLGSHSAAPNVHYHQTNVILPNVYGTADRNGLNHLARQLQPHLARQVILSSRG